MRSRMALVVAALALASPLAAQQVCGDPEFRVAWDDGLAAASRYRVMYPDSARSAHQAVDTSLGVALDSLNALGNRGQPDARIRVGFLVDIFCARWDAVGGEVVVDSTAIRQLQAQVDSLQAVVDSLRADDGPPPPTETLPVAEQLTIVPEGGGSRHAARWLHDAPGAEWRVTVGGTVQTQAGQPQFFDGRYFYDFGRLVSGEVCVQYVGDAQLGEARCITVGGEPGEGPGEPVPVAVRVLPATFDIELAAAEGEVQSLPTSQPVWAVVDMSDGRPYLCDGQLREALLMSSTATNTSKPDRVQLREGGNTLAGPCTVAWCVTDPAVATLTLDDGSTAPACSGGLDGGLTLNWRGRDYTLR